MNASRLRIVLAEGAALGEPFLRDAVPEAELVPVDAADDGGLSRALQHADAVVISALTATHTANAERLRLVHTLGAGTEGIADDALPQACALCNVFEHETAIGEWVLMAMLALTRRLLVYDRDVRRGEWGDAVWFDGVPEQDLRERTVGLVGLGHIGARVAELARAIGMRTIAVTRKPSPRRAEGNGLEWLGGMDELHRLLEESDFAVLSLPIAPDTEGLMGEDELDALGPDSYLLNVGRGPVADEQALYAALRDRRIAGAGLDVWYRYPSSPGERVLPASVPFWELDNVVMTPHAAGWTRSTVEGRWKIVAEQTARLRDGEPLLNVVRRG